MRYKIIKNRGVLRDGAPLLLDERKPLVIDFEDLPSEDFILVLKRERSVDKEIVVTAKERVEIDVYRLKAGTYNVELKRQNGALVNGTIICTPLHVQTLSSMASGLVCYPEIDAVIERVAELEKAVADLIDWQNEVKDKIHVHNIIK